MQTVTIQLPDRQRLDGAGLPTLVRAIVAAAPDEPETDALEWKGALELSSRKARFQIARTLLGFGNRTVEKARATFGGHAYLVAGAEPGKLSGVVLPDPAELENALDAFIAQGHPSWRLHRVEVDGVTVAVIEVMPPAAGDPICCLRSTYDTAIAGRVFVRRQGQTCEAGPDAIRALEERYAAQAIALQLQAHDMASQHLTLEQERASREREDRAEREAPWFMSGRIGDQGFVHVAPDEVHGIVRNTGRTAATVTDTRLRLDPSGSYPGSGVPVYGPGVTGDLGIPFRVGDGDHAFLRYVHPNLQALAQNNGLLTVELLIEDQRGLRWRQLLVLRRSGADQEGRHRWTLRDNESERERLGESLRQPSASS
jgi:hypothetical protein